MQSKTNTVRRKPCDEFELYRADPTEAQLYLWLAPERRLAWVDWGARLGEAVTPAVWYERLRRYAIGDRNTSDDIPTGAGVQALLEEALPLLAAICDGHEIVGWGERSAGQLDADGAAASEELEDALAAWIWDDAAVVHVIGVDAWLSEVGVPDVEGRTDSELAELAAQIDQEAFGQGSYIVEDVTRHLMQSRDAA